MKHFSLSLALLFLAALPTIAAVNVSSNDAGTLGKMPGSALDFTFFGNAAEFAGLAHYNGSGTGNSLQPTVLTDFTVAAGTNADGQYGGGTGAYASILTPTGLSQIAGDIFANDKTSNVGKDLPNIVKFTLGKVGSTFDFSAFNVYVMYGMAPGDGNDHDTAIDYTLLASNGTTILASGSAAVTQTNASLSAAQFEQFTITGASAGEILELGAYTPAKSGGDTAYLGGVSFAEVPEPSTWAMLAAGCGFLLFRLRRKNP